MKPFPFISAYVQVTYVIIRQRCYFSSSSSSFSSSLLFFFPFDLLCSVLITMVHPEEQQFRNKCRLNEMVIMMLCIDTQLLPVPYKPNDECSLERTGGDPFLRTWRFVMNNAQPAPPSLVLLPISLWGEDRGLFVCLCETQIRSSVMTGLVRAWPGKVHRWFPK